MDVNALRIWVFEYLSIHEFFHVAKYCETFWNFRSYHDENFYLSPTSGNWNYCSRMPHEIVWVSVKCVAMLVPWRRWTWSRTYSPKAGWVMNVTQCVDVSPDLYSLMEWRADPYPSTSTSNYKFRVQVDVRHRMVWLNRSTPIAAVTIVADRIDA